MNIAYLILAAAALHGIEHKSLVAGQPLRNGQPEEIRSINGKLEVTLDVSLITTDDLGTPNGPRVAPGYNGAAVGPTLRAKPGDRVCITLVNSLAESTEDEQEKMAFAMSRIPRKKTDELNNQTILINRLSPEGNLRSPETEFWGKNYQNLHFHGVLVDPLIGEN